MADNGGGAVAISTPEGLEWYGRRSVLGALTIECRTGMRHSRGSAMAAANQHVLEMFDAGKVREITGVVLPAPWGAKRTKLGALGDLALSMLLMYGPENGAIPATTRGALGANKAAAIERKAARITAKAAAHAAAQQDVRA